MIRPFLLSTLLCASFGAAQAHEFWIEAEDYSVAPGETVTARFRVGEKLSGSSFSYLPNRTARYEMIVGGEARPVPVRIGDNPAFAVPDLPEGLLIVVHETTDSTLTYRDKGDRTGWERFVGFTEHKAMDGVPEAHLQRGLPQEEVREKYRRFAKALIAVGDGDGSDREVGLRSEIVAEANPYTDNLGGGLPVRVLLDGLPRPGAQVELFARAPDGEVEVTLHETDAEGRAMLPVQPGYEYLADSVAMVPLDPQSDGAMWHSLWAALTFAVPAE
ncbi:DUF4198 domain-containing protein [Jannaschia aquimarina]|uniref:Nickel uptake substrate-specific transmembrane region n=1 Tax=Jannaschia aquimarina TaxID=935700 RepID=A0A0D1CKL1_9RHOB|nr:DUF4198 domain-containing protein [Jannaschia aquimarina]KIT15292.1 Nickel uptake substrate-specific transmembrane region [Jannaschia aquimarina]SNT25238.1 Uncharacterized conserved protein, contains GH25 family domain [Jannaschia aquimarina]